MKKKIFLTMVVAGMLICTPAFAKSHEHRKAPKV